MIYTVTLNPALDKTVEIPDFSLDSVNRIVSVRSDPGGKGINVSKVIQKLGGKSVAMGILGGTAGRALQEALDMLELKSDFLFVDGETRTNMKIIDPVNHTNTDLNEPGPAVSEEVLRKLLDRLLAKLKKGDITVISGSLPKRAEKDTYYRWVKACREVGAKVFLDVDGELLQSGIQASPSLIKPNHHELSALLGREPETVEETAYAARSLMDTYGIRKAVVSMGSRGALYVTEKETIYAEGLKVPVKSTVGAGDSVVAALAVAEEEGKSLEETVRLSIAAGAANVMCSGTQAAEYETVKELMPKVVYRRIGETSF